MSHSRKDETKELWRDECSVKGVNWRMVIYMDSDEGRLKKGHTTLTANNF